MKRSRATKHKVEAYKLDDKNTKKLQFVKKVYTNFGERLMDINRYEKVDFGKSAGCDGGVPKNLLLKNHERSLSDGLNEWGP